MCMCMGVAMENIMETWYLILISLCISFLFKAILTLLFPSKPKPTGKLPPGPITLPIIGSFLWLYKSFADLEPLLHNLHEKYGAIVTLHIGTHTAIFIRSRSLAHQALIQNGAVFSDRPPALLADKIITTNLRNISCASYGPTWRLFRRNLTSGILHPARVKSYSRARKWVLDILINSLQLQSKVRVKDHLQYSMFCLLALMCFGDRLDENKIKEIEAVQRRLLLGTGRFSVLNLWPSWLAKILFRKRWEELLQIYKHQEAVLVPLINARKKTKPMCNGKEDDHDGEEAVISYVDTLLELQLPDEKRKLDEVELVILCSEFLSAGTDTTSTALEWIMANLVKHPHIQERLLTEIKGVVVDGEEEVKEEDLQTMPYLKAVVFEGLRRHPPGHFVLPHAVTEDVVLDGCLVPKNGSVNFMVAEMGWDPKVWEDPMAFKPERFLKEDQSDGEDHIIDITGTKKIKMMPFGVGRRICPAYALAMLHLEYFVANLVLKFEWTAADQVDLTEKQEFTVVMKNPLQARISPRLNKY